VVNFDWFKILSTREERFWLKVLKSDGCWLWNGVLDKDGYGFFGITHCVGRDKYSRNFRAHRLAWSYRNKRPVPDGMVVMHTCDIPRCVNPDHLRVGTNADNQRDRVNKGHKPLGPKQQSAIRVLRKSPGLTASELNRIVGISWAQLLCRQLQVRGVLRIEGGGRWSPARYFLINDWAEQ
jgi:hypothetical protein